MMKFIEKFRASPVYVAMMARDDFAACDVVPLPVWHDLDRASVWCEHRWRSGGRKYRRRIRAGERAATFEFSTAIDALAFRLAAQRRFKIS